ncbi:cation:proton antiporter [Rhizobium sp. BK376]|jgi:multicomponent Na+:H+ antiporter subunit F|uniref:cation:proton antiporter n=1 Tax=Rhizobium sp. BK376 TaxID=2512149 RepID=UPI00104A274C|nr:cation:proton antiporter [Rhizobium sp. BK376]TCR93223.1 multicomponent Na+:H+ antiporter subunit F [Rhizobium sp. BK376]
MTPSGIISIAATLSLAILGLAFLVTIFRVVSGPTLPDRVLGLDMLVAVAIGFIAVIAVKTGFALYIDIAIALGLVGFLATVAFARFILAQAPQSGRGHGEKTVTQKVGKGQGKARNMRKVANRRGQGGRGQGNKGKA